MTDTNDDALPKRKLGTPYKTPSGATAAQFTEARFKGPTRSTLRAVTVAITSTQILDNNPKRVHAAIVNISAQQGYFNYDNNVSSSNGILLGAGGGSMTESVDEDGESVAWPMFGLNVGASGVWMVYEVFRV